MYGAEGQRTAGCAQNGITIRFIAWTRVH